MSLKHSLNQPFPYDTRIRTKLFIALVFGLFVFGFLNIFKPFDLDQFTPKRMLWIGTIYGFITTGCIFLSTVCAPLIFPAFFEEKTWTTGKQILFIGGIILIVGLANFFVAPTLVDTTLNFKRAIWFQGITLAVGLLPVSVFVLVRQNQLLKRFSGEAAIIEKERKQKQVIENGILMDPSTHSRKIVLTSDYQEEQLEIYIDDLHLITAAGNYIKVYHLNNERLIYSILRCTLKKAEETTLPYSNFFKCHRTYIINLDKVRGVEGNAQGYKLRIEGFEEFIPVSRGLSAEFSDKLLAFRKRTQVDRSSA
jgi:hypothetical protein